MTKTKFWDIKVGEDGREFHGQILASNKKRFVKEPEAEDPAVPSVYVTYVLVAGAIGDYAVYEGVGNPEWIKEYGNKLTFKEASAVFSGLDEKRYRR
jgi:hypothetical protein